jgi:tetratricopeptide (TPR) repeat protein
MPYPHATAIFASQTPNADIGHENRNEMFDFFKKKQDAPPPTAAALHQAARADGQAGNFDAAIEKLEAAILLEPNWAYPYYDLAFSYLLNGNAEQALHYYRKTDELEPRGFFTAKTAIYALEGESAGKFPPGTYYTYLQIEWFDSIPRKLATAQVLTQQVPQFAPGWMALFKLLEDPTEKLMALETGRSLEGDAETVGMLTLNKALILSANGNRAAAKSLVAAMIASPATTQSNLALAQQVIAQLD